MSEAGRPKKRGKMRPQFKKPMKLSEREDIEAKELAELYSKVEPSRVKTFRDLPLSGKTQIGLRESGYESPTDVQREAIVLALRGLDVLGAAKTGSGKTLAFVVPLLERLFRSKWSRFDGLGALVITPTRELALQIFETLRKVGRRHDFSAGLVIGGKDLRRETKRLSTCNIVVCTPGRLLHHMDENPHFDSANLQLLVLDEADRCLDMGFSRTMNAILENLPAAEQRQTLLFSATQTRSVKDLARLSLSEPVYVSVHEHAAASTPDGLRSQSYAVCELGHKLNLMWSFVRSHRRKKTLVFLQSCKQVRFAAEIFRRMRCGATVVALYGTLHQLRRMAVYEEFCAAERGVMFATDIAARGLDFPAVDWVLQVDCPEDATTYLHRVGRTARNAAVGQSLLVLMPSEEQAMLQQLRARKVPIEKIEVNPKKMTDVQRKVQAHLASDHLLKECAQRAFQSYLKSTFLLKNKAVFDVTKLDTEAFALSLGLGVAPRVRFLQRHLKKAAAPPSGAARLVSDSEDEDGGSILTVKRRDHDLAVQEEEEGLKTEDGAAEKKKVKVVTKVAAAKKVLKKKYVQHNQVIRFDDDGEGFDAADSGKLSKEGKEYELDEGECGGGGIDIDKAKEVMRAEDKFDRQKERERRKEKKKEEKRKLKELMRLRRAGCEGDDDDGDEPVVHLGSGGIESDEASDGEGRRFESGDEESNEEPSEGEEVVGRSSKANKTRNDSNQDEESDDEERPSNLTGKRRWKAPKKPKQPAAKRSRAGDVELPGEDLGNVEDLAMQLLSRRL